MTQNDMRQTDRSETPETPAAELFAGYDAFLREIKGQVQAARTRAAFAVNAELVLLYWTVGREISQRMQEHGWGSKVVDRLAGDLRREFPDMRGFSLRNLRYMRSFAEAWPDGPILQAPLAKGVPKVARQVFFGYNSPCLIQAPIQVLSLR